MQSRVHPFTKSYALTVQNLSEKTVVQLEKQFVGGILNSVVRMVRCGALEKMGARTVRLLFPAIRNGLFEERIQIHIFRFSPYESYIRRDCKRLRIRTISTLLGNYGSFLTRSYA